MEIETDGAFALLPTQSRDVNPSFEFWQRHRKLFDDAGDLWLHVAGVSDLCQRFLAYVSADLYWVTRDGASPLAADAFAAGLLNYRAAREAEHDQSPGMVNFGSYRAFVDAILDHAAARLSSVMLLSGDDSWSAMAGEPLQPWLSRRSYGIVVLNRQFRDAREQQIRAAMGNYVRDRREADTIDFESLC